MRILLLGATGRTGKLLLEQTLEHGHIVHALVRDKQKIPFQKYNLLIHEGTPIDKAALAKAMQGCEAVLSALNISRRYEFPWSGLRTPKDFLSGTMRNIVELSAKNNFKRLVFISPWGVGETKKICLVGFTGWLIIAACAISTMIMKDRKGLQKAQPLTGLLCDQFFFPMQKSKKEVVVSSNNPKPDLYISRRNLAAFMLQVLEKNSYNCQAPVVSEK